MLRLERLSISNGGLTPRSQPSIRPNMPPRVTGRRLDLDDVGAPVGQDAGRGRSGHPDPELDDFDAFYRSRHG